MMAVDDRNKRVARNTIFLYLRMLFLIGVNLYTSHALLDAMGVQDFGTYNVVGGVVLMFSFLNTAMAVGTQRYLSYEMGRNSQRLNDVFTASVNVHFLISVIVLLLAETIGLWFLNTHMEIPIERMEAANVVFHASMFSFFFMINSVPYISFIMSREDMNVYAVITSVDMLLKLAAVFALGLIAYDALKLYPCLLVLVSVFVFLLYVVYCRRHYPESHYRFKFDKALFLELFKYSNWNLFGGFASVCSNYGVNILLNIVFGPAINAARGLAYQVNTAVTQFTVSFQTAMNPPIVKAYAQEDKTYMNALIYRGARYSYLLLFFIVLPLFIHTPYVLDLWLPVVPEYTVSFVRWVLATSLIDCLSGTLMTASQASGRIKLYQSAIGALLLLNLPLSYVLLTVCPMPEIAFVVAFVIASVALLVRLRIVSRLVPITMKDFVRETIVRILPITLLCPVLPVAITIMLPADTVLNFLLTTVVCVVSCAVVYWTIGLNKEERAFILQRISILNKRIKKR